jgi:hypothetical protein
MLTKDFILAGNAIFTVTSPELAGEHRTYRVRLAHFEDDARDWYFADLLTGPDNTRDYTYLGRVDKASGQLLRTSKSPPIREDPPMFTWVMLSHVLEAIWTGEELEGIDVQHADKCGRCGRLLTDPESIERGIGPVCREALG